MAIVQVSRITHRKGLSENLPQLAGAEFGWVVDERKLYIGNGTLAEGAPAIGNTEILTQYSDLLSYATAYTYKGEAGGYTVQTGPSSSSPTTRTLQRKIDDFASVKDFGATGDGNTDDTAAINRAMFELFCREINPEIRRGLFFPAGKYVISSAILIPPFAKIFGEGLNSSIIELAADSTDTWVASCADSLFQAFGSVGANGADYLPQDIIVQDLTFQSAKSTDCFLLEQATDITFSNVGFIGPFVNSDLVDGASNIAALRFDSTLANVVSNIVCDGCEFKGFKFAIDVNERVEGCSLTNCNFNTLFAGIRLGVGTPIDGGPTGFKITHNYFDNIARVGIQIGDAADNLYTVKNNVSGYNIFLDVGTNFYGGDATPVTSIISLEDDFNASIGDMFERSDANDAILPRIDVNNKLVYALDNGRTEKFGTYVRKAGEYFDLSAAVSPTELFTVNINVTEAFNIRYTFKDDNNAIVRHGTLNVVAAEDPGDSTGSLTYDEDYIENNYSGLVLSADQSGNVVTVNYTATTNGIFTYSLNHLG